MEGRLTPNTGRYSDGPYSSTTQATDGRLWVSPAEKALAAIWTFYGEDPRRGDICARIAAFYLLMSRSETAVFSEWILESPGSSGETVLSPLLIEAVATAPLQKQLPYSEASFLAFLRQGARLEHSLA